MRRFGLFLVLCSGQMLPSPVSAGEFLKETQKFISPTPSPSAYFGVSIAMSGQYSVVGAEYDDADGTDAGAAFVYQHNADGAWSLAARLSASNPTPNSLFGSSVDIDGDRIIVGNSRRQAWIFERVGATWSEVDQISIGTGESQVARVAIDGDRVLISDPLDDDLATDAGAGFLFERQSNGEWVLSEKLLASNGKASDFNGYDIDLSGDVAVMASSRHRSLNLPNQPYGIVYVFTRQSDGIWSEQSLVSDDTAPTGAFGTSVSLDGNELLVGDSGNDSRAGNAGAAFVFIRQPSGVWQQSAKLTGSRTTDTDFFGSDVALSQGRALISATSGDGELPDTGAVYLFVRTSTGSWQESAILIASDSTTKAQLGLGLAMDGSQALAGNRLDNSAAPYSGAVYAYDLGTSWWLNVPTTNSPWLQIGPAFRQISHNYAWTTVFGAPPQIGGVIGLFIQDDQILRLGFGTAVIRNGSLNGIALQLSPLKLSVIQGSISSPQPPAASSKYSRAESAKTVKRR